MLVLKITNDAKTELKFQVEPEGCLFSLSLGESARIHFDYEHEPPEITFGETIDPIFGVVFPGDGSLKIEKNGEIVIDTYEL